MWCAPHHEMDRYVEQCCLSDYLNRRSKMNPLILKYYPHMCNCSHEGFGFQLPGLVIPSRVITVWVG